MFYFVVNEFLVKIYLFDLLYAFFRGDGHHLIRAAERNGLDDLASVFSDDLLFNGHISHVDRFCDLFSEDILFRDLDFLELETESYIFVNVQVRKERVLLENRVYGTLVGRKIRNVLSFESNRAFVGSFEARYHSERGRLAAAAGTEQGHELAALYFKIDMVDYGLAVVNFCKTVELDNVFSLIVLFLVFHCIVSLVSECRRAAYPKQLAWLVGIVFDEMSFVCGKIEGISLFQPVSMLSDMQYRAAFEKITEFFSFVRHILV